MATTSVEVPRDLVLRQTVRDAAIVGVAGLIAGVIVGGLGGRIVMRIAAIAAPSRVNGIFTENGNVIGDITIGGTIALVIFVGMLGGVFGAIAYVIIEPWIGWARRLRPLAFGLALMAVAGHMVIVPHNFDFAILRNEPLNVTMFLALFPIFGLTIAGIRHLLDARFPRIEDIEEYDASRYIVPVAIGAMLIPILMIQYFSEESCGCKPAPVLGSLVVLTALATLATWAIVAFERVSDRWSLPVRIVGHAALAGAVVVGALRLTSDARELL